MTGSQRARGGAHPPNEGEGVTDEDGHGAAGTDRVDRSVISVPLLERLQTYGAAAGREPWLNVVVDLDYTFPGGVGAAARKVRWMLRACAALAGHGQLADGGATERDAPAPLRIEEQDQFLFANVPASVVEAVAALDRAAPDDAAWDALQAVRPFAIARRRFTHRAVHRIWPDFVTRALRRA